MSAQLAPNAHSQLYSPAPADPYLTGTGSGGLRAPGVKSRRTRNGRGYLSLVVCSPQPVISPAHPAGKARPQKSVHHLPADVNDSAAHPWVELGQDLRASLAFLSAPRVRRQLLGFAIACLVALGIGWAVGTALSTPSPTVHSYTAHVVQPGETLWSIAADYPFAGMDGAAQVELLKETNFLDTDQLSVGQKLLLPQ